MPILVNSPTTLAALVHAVSGATRVALDTESDGFYRYRPQLCLVQVAAGDVVALVDPLCGLDLTPLWTLLAQPGRESVLHDAEQDVSLLSRRHNLALGRIFDTQVAARFVGLPQVGLAGVASTLLGIHLDKGEQRSDWARRPLTDKQVRYAADDVLHLLRIQDALTEKLTSTGRLDMARQTFERVRTRVLPETPVDMEGWRRMKDARGLSALQKGALEAAWRWREEAAQARNVATFRVMGNEALLEVVRRLPADTKALAGVPGVGAGLANGPDGAALLERLALARPVDGPLLPPRPPETDEDRAADARFDALRAWRARTGAAMGLDVALLVTNAVLRELARTPPNSLEDLARLDLLPWQLEHLGAPLLEALRAPPPVPPPASPPAA